MRVALIGAGKMGLPIACRFAEQGAEVTACDANPAVVDAINRGECLIDEPGIPELVAKCRAAGRLKASGDIAGTTRASDVVVIIVPAVLTEHRRADLSILEAVTRQVAQGLQPGTLVCYETTVPVGSTRSVFLPLLEEGGLTAGEQFYLAYSPERVKSNLVLKFLGTTPKVVGGVNAESARRAEAFYAKYLGAPVSNVATLEAAEFVKLAGMVYRDVNIALSSELARYAEAIGVDMGSIIAAANTDGEANLLIPGIGVGGHCTPVYPYFLTWDAQERRVPVTLAERARRVNDGQSLHALRSLEAQIGPLRGRRVLILGLAFRPGVKEHHSSTAFLLREDLRELGAEVTLHDPLYSAAELAAHGFTPAGWDTVPEVVVLNTAHAEYRDLDFGGLAARGLKAVLDGRNLWDPERVRGAGLVYQGIGRPSPTVEKRSRIPVALPDLSGAEAEAAADAVRSGWVVQGPRVEAFERAFAAYTGAPHAVALSSCTAGLHAALLALGVGPGDEVVTVSHSYIATANAIRFCGAAPVFVDIDPRTYNLDPDLLEAAITPRTRVIMPVHQVGLPCDLAQILEIAGRHGIPVLEDAACAIGSQVSLEVGWERIGRPRGVAACFSFHPRKILTTGDGGMLVTADRELARKVRLLREHGMSLSAAARHSATTIQSEEYPIVGFNYRMTDIQAGVGREQLARLPEMLERRGAVAERYNAVLRDIPGLEPPFVPDYARTNYQSYVVRVTAEYGRTRDELMQLLLDRGISTRRGVMNAHQEQAYAGMTCPPLPHSEAARAETLILPLYSSLSAADQDRVLAALAEARVR